MTVGNIATDGYGLNAIERPNVPVNGYGTGLPTGLFDGSVTGIGISSEVIESFFEELLIIDAEIEHAVALDDTVTVTELTGTPLAQALMVGVGQSAQVLGSDITVEALDGADSDGQILSGDDAPSELLGSDSASTVVDSVAGAAPDMMGTDDTETGVV